jgi:hypothetical protein
MSKTAKRSKHSINDGSALFLMVRGTTDRLRGLNFYKAKKPCPCCGGKDGGKWILNDAGRSKLQRLRDRRARRP